MQTSKSVVLSFKDSPLASNNIFDRIGSVALEDTILLTT